MNKNIKAHLALLSANILFGLNMPNVKQILLEGEVSVLALNYTRLAGGAILFWIASLFMPKEKIEKRDLLMLLPASIMGIQLNQLSFIFASQYSSPVDLSIIATLVPIVTMVLASVFLKEPITLKKSSGVLMGAAGALIIVLGAAPSSVIASNPTLGNSVFLICILFFAGYLTIFKSIISKYSPMTFMKWMFLYACIMQFPLCIKDVVSVNYSELSTMTILGMIYAGVGACFCSYFLLGYGQKHVRPTVVSMYNYMQPFTVFVVAIFLGSGYFSWKTIIAAALVFSGVYFVTQSKTKE